MEVIELTGESNKKATFYLENTGRVYPSFSLSDGAELAA
jgi:hypothetical protein